MARDGARRTRLNNAVLVYVVLLLSLQIFLLTIAVEGFFERDAGLAWAATGISVFLALTAIFFYRYLRDD